MKTLTRDDLKLYEKFLYNRGRDIEIAKYNYFFLEGERIDVAFALTIYQNRDGGFGHGLEPDSLNPYSSPLQTAEALKILKHVGYDASTKALAATDTIVIKTSAWGIWIGGAETSDRCIV